MNYRTFAALDRCLTSLQPHLHDDDEVVVVDWESDASQVAPLAGAHSRVRFLTRAGNGGFAAGVNAAATSTSAPILLLLNPDTIVAGPIVRALADWCMEHPECALARPTVLNADGTVQPSARRFPGMTTVLGGRSTWLTRRFPNNWFTRRNLLAREAPPHQRAHRGATEVDWLAGSCFATPRGVFERLGGLDESFFMYWEDADYCRRAAALGLRCHYVPVADVRHTGGASSAHNVVPSIRAFHRSAFRLFWKHGGVGRIFAPSVWAGLQMRSAVKIARLAR